MYTRDTSSSAKIAEGPSPTVSDVALLAQNDAPSTNALTAIAQNVPSQAPIIHGFLLAVPIPGCLSTPALGIIALGAVYSFPLRELSRRAAPGIPVQ